MTTVPGKQPPLLNDRYQIILRVGQNRLALVFQANDVRLSRPVLVHVLRPELEDNAQLRQRFLDEGQGLARCTHPALLDVYDRGEVGGRPYMVTEFISGQTLRDALPLPLNVGLRVLRQVVGALAVASAAQALLPPIASDCILLMDAGRPMLADPWWLEAEALRDALGQYRAPERSTGGPPTDRSLVYSLGLLGYELVLGQRPWTPAAAQTGAHELPSLYAELPGFMPTLASALALATARELHARTLDVQAFSRDLAAVESAADSPTRPLVRPVPALRDTMREVRRTITQRRQQAANLPPPSQMPSAQAAPAPQVALPRPVMPPTARHAPPSQPIPAPQPGLTRDELRKELRKEIRRESRRRGCLSFVSRRLVTLLFLALLAGGCWIGYIRGQQWFNGLDIRGWICNNTPALVCNALPATSSTARGPATYRVAAEANLRASPTQTSQAIRLLPAGQIVIADTPDATRQAEGFEWVQVQTEIDGIKLEGWMVTSLLEETP